MRADGLDDVLAPARHHDLGEEIAGAQVRDLGAVAAGLRRVETQLALQYDVEPRVALVHREHHLAPAVGR